MTYWLIVIHLLVQSLRFLRLPVLVVQQLHKALHVPLKKKKKGVSVAAVETKKKNWPPGNTVYYPAVSERILTRGCFYWRRGAACWWGGMGWVTHHFCTSLTEGWLSRLSGSRVTSLMVLARRTGSSFRRNMYDVFSHAFSLPERHKKSLSLVTQTLPFSASFGDKIATPKQQTWTHGRDEQTKIEVSFNFHPQALPSGKRLSGLFANIRATHGGKS